MRYTFKTKKSVLWIWFFGSFFMAYQFLLQVMPNVMIAPMSKSLNVSTLGVSVLSSAYFYTYIVLQIPAGIMVDRLNIRYVYSVSLALLALSCIAFALSQHFAYSILLRIMMGIFAAPGLVSAFYLINHWFLKKYFPLFIGLSEMYGMLACSLGEIGLAQGVIYLGWQNTVLLYGLLGFVMAILSYFIVKDRPPNPVRAASRVRASTFQQDIKKLFVMPEVWVAGLISGFAFAILSAFAGFWCVPFLQANFHLSLAQASSVTAIMFFGTAICAPFTGFIIERIQYCEYSMAVALLLSALLFMILLLMPHLSLSVIAVILFLLGCLATVYIIPFSYVRRRVPDEISGTAMGMTNMLSIVIGAPLLQPMIGLIDLGLWLLPVSLMVSCGMSLWLANYRRSALIIDK